ncbi:hypothetical protein K466DRAFT_256382 [Polyporus arcularius HHB13444]|uniref:Uncharacterized protein n=1 Tax=Polyporus arcularius HHB13444 TaxID=1314778 RepID=A0A5C3PQW3_9APHY|nr:hypothetical protein K466DRAFT_256382 [Polyporus arcularius HHB13444]
MTCRLLEIRPRGHSFYSRCATPRGVVALPAPQPSSVLLVLAVDNSTNDGPAFATENYTFTRTSSAMLAQIHLLMLFASTARLRDLRAHETRADQTCYVVRVRPHAGTKNRMHGVQSPESRVAIPAVASAEATSVSSPLMSRVGCSGDCLVSRMSTGSCTCTMYTARLASLTRDVAPGVWHEAYQLHLAHANDSGVGRSISFALARLDRLRTCLTHA